MTTAGPDAGAARPGFAWVRDSALIALAVGTAYSLLAPDILWGGDSLGFLHDILSGETNRSAHLLYLPLVGLGSDAGAVLGLDAFSSLRAVSSWSVAVGVGALHQAAVQLGASRARAAELALILAATPAVAFFGMILEIQGVLFGASALAWLATARFVKRPGARQVVVLSALTGLAACVHSSGHLLPVAIAVFVATLVRAPVRRWLWWGIVGACCHALVPTLLWALTDLPVATSLRASAQFIDTAAELTTVLGTSVSVTLHEWLIPYIPLSITVFGALREQRLRLQLLGLVLVALLYAFVTWPLHAASWGGQVVEHGGYYLPLAFPLAWLTIAQQRRWRTSWMWLAGTTMTAVLIWGDCIKQADAFDTQGAVEIMGRQDSILLTHSSEDVLEFVRQAPSVRIYRLDQATGVTARSDALFQMFDLLYDRAEERGQRVYLTETLRHSMELAELPLGIYIRRNYTRKGLSSGSFVCHGLTRRAR